MHQGRSRPWSRQSLGLPESSNRILALATPFCLEDQQALISPLLARLGPRGKEVPLQQSRLYSLFCILALPLTLAGCGSGSGGTGSGSGSSLPSVTVSGASQVRLGSTVTFAATAMNLSNPAVTWQVNGVAGGNGTVGKIDTNGVYTPPASIPTNNSVTVTAVSQASPSVSGSAPLEHS